MSNEHQASMAVSKLSIALSLSLYLLLLSVVNSSSSSEDPYKILRIVRSPNGTYTRLDKYPQSPPSLSPPILSKDLKISDSKHTWARIYLPNRVLDSPPHSNSKLPLIVFYHGGGFVFYSAASTYFHDFCIRLANATHSLVVSVDYRLAPEHRLPAAYRDSVDALHFITAVNDLWLGSYADFTRCYLMGESAGGNIAYNAGLRAAAEGYKLKPLTIRGLILIQPFFGGVNRTSSELRLGKSLTLPLIVTDSMWKLSLPIGADRDHKYSNPTVNGGAKVLDKIRKLGWKVVVFGCDGDQLLDRQVELVKLLNDKGVRVEGNFYSGGRHGIFIGDPSMSDKVFHSFNALH